LLEELTAPCCAPALPCVGPILSRLLLQELAASRCVHLGLGLLDITADGDTVTQIFKVYRLLRLDCLLCERINICLEEKVWYF